MLRITEDAQGVRFAVRIVPRSSRSEIAGESEGALRIRIAAPPVDGAANRELIKLLAKQCRVPQSAVAIVSGAGAKTKLVRVAGVRTRDIERLAIR